MRSIRTIRARDKFLSVLSETCNVSEAARAAKISRRAAYEWRDDDPAFRADWDEAIEVAVDGLEQVAWDRAKVDKSDRMLEILLKAHRGHKYRDKQAVELTGKDGNPIEIDQVNTDADAFTRAIIGIAARRGAGSSTEEPQH